MAMVTSPSEANHRSSTARASSGYVDPGRPSPPAYDSTARLPASRSAVTAASVCSGVWWIWEMSSTVVTPASSCARPANSVLSRTSSGR